MLRNPTRSTLVALVTVTLCLCTAATGFAQAEHSIARIWVDETLDAIRISRARPPVHARNLYHLSAAMYDAWAAYDGTAAQVLHEERTSAPGGDVDAARREAISYAAFRLLIWRFKDTAGAATSIPAITQRMQGLGFDPTNAETSGNSPSALGNRIAEAYITFGLSDGSNEANDYANQIYQPVNEEFFPELEGNPTLTDPNRWQPLAFADGFVDQSNIPANRIVPEFLSPEWGNVKGFALTPADLTVHQRDGTDWFVYHDPGPPPLYGTSRQDEYLDGFQLVVERSGDLDPTDGVMMDISPGALGNNPLGENTGTGHPVNPSTGQPYAAQVVPAADFYRVIAEFWADGPDSETPPGHWFSIAHIATDHPAFERRIAGRGPIVDALQYDVKLYLTLGGAMHDAAVSAWGIKGYYDYIRPISALRGVGVVGQRSDPGGRSFHDGGLRVVPGKVEIITPESIQEGERHEHLSFFSATRNIGEVAVKAWRGPAFVSDPDDDTAGVGWILLRNWWPYQRPNFVTPPFAGYVSGHSTFSRAAAEALAAFTGDEYFPGGLGEFPVPQNDFLVFEQGPSVPLTLQWATYFDASDESSLSRIWGGIHPPADDIPGRLVGSKVGRAAFAKAQSLFAGGAECTAGPTTFCLNGGRYRVEVTWTDFAGNSGAGQTVAGGSTADSGLFWFFDESNWELMVKVLDGCAVNGNVWVFGAATSDVEFHITVTDIQTGATKTYSNPLGNAAQAITDTSAFPTGC